MPVCPGAYIDSTPSAGTIRKPNSPGFIAYLGHSVGVGAVGDLGRARAVGLVRGNDLGGVLGHIGGSRVSWVAGRDASDEGSGSDSEIHFG